MKLSKNKTILILDKISLCLSIVVVVLCALLYGQSTGFLKGENYAISTYSPELLEENSLSFNPGAPDDFELISISYIFVFVVSSIVLLIHLFGKKVFFKYLNLLLLCLPVFNYYYIFKSKLIVIKNPSDFPRFELFRQAVAFDIVGAFAIVSLLIIQIILIVLILKREKTS